MAWAMLILLALNLATLIYIAASLDNGVSSIWEIVHASGQANQIAQIEINNRLNDIERHVAQMTKAFRRTEDDESDPDGSWLSGMLSRREQ